METTFIKDVDAAGFATDVVARSHEVPVVVDFWAAWCGPCRVLGPTLERLADEFQGGFELAKLDVDANQALAQQFQVQGIPTVIAFRNGEVVNRFTGAIPEPQIRTWLRDVIPSASDEKAAAAMSALESGDAGAAQQLLREALDLEPAHEQAAAELAQILLDAGRAEEALRVMEPVPPTSQIQRLRATARMGTVDTSSIDDLEAKLDGDPENGVLLVHLGTALGAAGRTQEALDVLLRAVALGGEPREEARKTILDMFEVLGPDHPLTGPYRRKLASALF